jgi:excinuclease ABC subunit A
MPLNNIIIKGAREHNLKNIDVTIPRDKLVAITGVSGSGKSSLAFDTIYAEGQRRYMESLAAYARQFLGRMEKPDVDYIEGLSPAISIDQKGPSHNPRSTVGTVTEIYDYLRLLFARVGHPHCPNCGREVTRLSSAQIADEIFKQYYGKRLIILAPVVKDRKGEYKSLFEDLNKAGFVRVRIDGVIHDLSEDIVLDKNKKHTIDVVVDRIIVDCDEIRSRTVDSIETALKLGNGLVKILSDDNAESLFSEHFSCPYCNISLGEIEPRTFSFNSPHGACPVCTGLGIKMEIDPDLVIPNKDLSISEGAIAVMGWSSWRAVELERLAHRYGFSTRTPVKNLKKEHLDLILYGENGTEEQGDISYSQYRDMYGYSYEGVIPNQQRLYRETESDYRRLYIAGFMVATPCPSCHGKRLKPESLAVTIDKKNIMDVTELSATHAAQWIQTLENPDGKVTLLSHNEQIIAHQIIKEISTRLNFLIDIGLGYLTLDRASATLSGGETQRIRLATQIGSQLMGVLYICDEPTIGLHPADIYRLINTVKKLRDLGNTVIIVEHDESMMRAADYIIDMGPGAGEHGGYIVATGNIDEIMANGDSTTGLYLSKRKVIPLPETRRKGNGKILKIKGARENNLKNIDVSIPLGKFVCITGVSGSGKSTLINEVLYKKIAQKLYKAKARPGKCSGITGLEYIDKVVNIDQSPIGRTPRSNPATYTGTFTPIRELFSTVPEAKVRGYRPGRFSFNVKGGRCEACQGEGYIQIEMQFLPDVTVPCEACKGKRYNNEALEVHFKGKNIADVLNMTVDEALEFFHNFPKISRKLATLKDVGLGYIRLGQPAPTLSGGEAQRVKLATELSRHSTGKTLYILDEPTTGLSFADIDCLLNVLQKLAGGGNTVLIIEHHMDVLKNADYIIDLGPGPGDEGGYIIAEGTPEEISGNEASLTGKYLKAVLKKPQLTGKLADNSPELAS